MAKNLRRNMMLKSTLKRLCEAKSQEYKNRLYLYIVCCCNLIKKGNLFFRKLIVTSLLLPAAA